MTTLAQAELTDSSRASHAKLKATRVLPREIALAINTKIDEGVEFSRFVDRNRWLRLIAEVMALPEVSP